MIASLAFFRGGVLLSVLSFGFTCFLPCSARAQPGPADAPTTYEVQIDGESFQVESGQRPVKVESKLKKGTTYTLAVRIAMTQVLRLNSVRMEYGMSAKVADDKGKDIRTALVTHNLGYSLRITDMGHVLDAAGKDKLLKKLADAAEKHYTDAKAANLVRTEPKSQKFGSSNGKWLKFTFKNEQGQAATSMIFVLSGDNYTVAHEAEFRDQDSEEALPWMKNALLSIRPLQP